MKNHSSTIRLDVRVGGDYLTPKYTLYRVMVAIENAAEAVPGVVSAAVVDEE